MSAVEAASRIVEEFRRMIESSPQAFCLPSLEISDIEAVGVATRAVFKSEPTLLRLTSPLVVVGDIHGEIFDLYRVFGLHGLPPRRKYLFLGDLVDRGEDSVSVVALVFALKLLFPEHVYVIRGNHEFVEMAKHQGFYSETEVKFNGSNIFQIYCDTFELIPLACLVDNSIFCVHGGITPSLRDLTQIDQIMRPIRQDQAEFVSGLLWSDPVESTNDFSPSRRGVGFEFGPHVTRSFLKDNRLKMIVRAHECVAEGVKRLFHGDLVTVFTASNYCGIETNDAGLLLIEDASHITHSTFNKEKDIEMGTVLPACPPKEKPMFVAPVRRSRSMGRPLLPKYRLCQSTESSLMLPKAFVTSARRLR